MRGATLLNLLSGAAPIVLLVPLAVAAQTQAPPPLTRDVIARIDMHLGGMPIGRRAVYKAWQEQGRPLEVDAPVFLGSARWRTVSMLLDVYGFDLSRRDPGRIPRWELQDFLSVTCVRDGCVRVQVSVGGREVPPYATRKGFAIWKGVGRDDSGLFQYYDPRLLRDGFTVTWSRGNGSIERSEVSKAFLEEWLLLGL